MFQNANAIILPAAFVIAWLGGMFLWTGYRLHIRRIRTAGGIPREASATRYFVIGGIVFAAGLALLIVGTLGWLR